MAQLGGGKPKLVPDAETTTPFVGYLLLGALETEQPKPDEPKGKLLECLRYLDARWNALRELERAGRLTPADKAELKAFYETPEQIRFSLRPSPTEHTAETTALRLTLFTSAKRLLVLYRAKTEGQLEGRPFGKAEQAELDSLKKHPVNHELAALEGKGAAGTLAREEAVKLRVLRKSPNSPGAAEIAATPAQALSPSEPARHQEALVATGGPVAGGADSSVTPIPDVTKLSFKQQEELAERYRANFLQKLSPDDWYHCYMDPKASNFAVGSVPDQLRSQGLSDAQLKPLMQREVFNRFVYLMFWKMSGDDIPESALFNCNNPPPGRATKTISEVAKQVFARGLRELMSAGMAQVPLSDHVYHAIVMRKEQVERERRQKVVAPRKGEAETGVVAQQGLRTAESVIAAALGTEESRSFPTDPPRVKAEKLARAARIIISQREWPNALFLWLAGGEGDPGLAFNELQNFYRDPNHPDVKAWLNMTVYQRGEALRRMFIAKMQLYEDVAAGKMALAQLLKRESGESISIENYDWEGFVGQAFGLDILRQYREAVASDDRNIDPGYKVDDLRAATHVYRTALLSISFVSM